VGTTSAWIVALALSAWRAYQRRPNFRDHAAVTATLLTVDAWFDVTTATGRVDRLVSLVAALIELPLAVLLAVAARRGRRPMSSSDSPR